mmetsp:Transcript_93580/g.241813  ORF Transcript_93580/g.241813 Transcript_93580/m.241813 type:complete len:204 (+) Transcript_93580:285-896(+)
MLLGDHAGGLGEAGQAQDQQVPALRAHRRRRGVQGPQGEWLGRGGGRGDGHDLCLRLDGRCQGRPQRALRVPGHPFHSHLLGGAAAAARGCPGVARYVAADARALLRHRGEHRGRLDGQGHTKQHAVLGRRAEGYPREVGRTLGGWRGQGRDAEEESRGALRRCGRPREAPETRSAARLGAGGAAQHRRQAEAGAEAKVRDCR